MYEYQEEKMKILSEEIATLRNTPASQVFDATPRYIAEVNRVLDMCVENLNKNNFNPEQKE